MQENYKLAFFIWLEIPYFVGINYEKTFSINYKNNIETQLNIKFRNDLFLVKTYNKLLCSDYSPSQFKKLEEFNQKFSSYITKDKLSEIQEFIQLHELPYLHIESTKTVIELYFEIDVSQSLYEEVINKNSLCPQVIFPESSFFSEQVFPKIADVINVYRVATLPALRYKIHPVSENLVEDAHIEIHDMYTNKIVKRWNHGFDLRNHGQAMQHHEINLGVQSRFNSLIENPDSIEFELQFCSAYYLFHMRRWAESVTIAAGVVDTLVKQLVLARKPIESEYEPILKIKYQQLFNKELPRLGYEKLSDVNQVLWELFVRAKDDRGDLAHGKTINSFQHNEQEKVFKHLDTFYEVARWLSEQNNRSWNLDINGTDKSFASF